MVKSRASILGSRYIGPPGKVNQASTLDLGSWFSTDPYIWDFALDRLSPPH
jgi:hypothetical protein